MNCYSIFRDIDTLAHDYDLAFKWKHEARLAFINVSLSHSSLNGHDLLTNGTTIRVEWGFIYSTMVCTYICIYTYIYNKAGIVFLPVSDIRISVFTGEWEFCGETDDAYFDFGKQIKNLASNVYHRVISQIRKSDIAPVPYPQIYNSEQKCTHFRSELCIVGTGALWNLWDWSILRPRAVTAGYIDQHQGLNDIVLIFIQQKQRQTQNLRRRFHFGARNHIVLVSFYLLQEHIDGLVQDSSNSIANVIALSHRYALKTVSNRFSIFTTGWRCCKHCCCTQARCGRGRCHGYI